MKYLTILAIALITQLSYATDYGLNVRISGTNVTYWTSSNSACTVNIFVERMKKFSNNSYLKDQAVLLVLHDDASPLVVSNVCNLIIESGLKNIVVMGRQKISVKGLNVIDDL